MGKASQVLKTNQDVKASRVLKTNQEEVDSQDTVKALEPTSAKSPTVSLPVIDYNEVSKTFQRVI